MTNYFISPHFRIAELVSREILTAFGERATWFIDPRIPVFLEFMRGRFGVTYLNNWIDGGKADSRGFRAPTDREGASMSQHRFGRATDTTYKNVTAEEVREDIKKNWKELYLPLGVTCIEDNVSWLHADFRYIQYQKELFIVLP